MGLRDLLKKKDALSQGDEAPPTQSSTSAYSDIPEFTIIRSDTVSQEVIEPPSHEDDDLSAAASASSPSHKSKKKDRHHSLNIFSSQRSLSGQSTSSIKGPETDQSQQQPNRSPSISPSPSLSSRPSAGRRLSHRLHLSRQPESSESVPADLPDIDPAMGPLDQEGATESQWEKRATILAERNEIARGRPTTPVESKPSLLPSSSPPQLVLLHQGSSPESTTPQSVDADIQEAIRLHEQGDYQQSTAIFGRLADPRGANNPLSQVLYGLALRHGWGCEPDPAKAVTSLSAAASNAASIEQLALQAGMKKGGAAKGELVLAIFELANCFRHGWGIQKDAYAAKQYYETAANLGDSDAMNEAAWCYLEGYGCKKDKFRAAQYYRRAEQAGSKTLGNSWIWKDKYNPPAVMDDENKRKK